MTSIEYKNNQLHIEKLNIQEITNSNQTPFYCYSASYIENQYDELHSAFDIDIKIDANHALAGKDLIFEIEVIEIA